MRVTFRLPAALRDFANGQSRVELDTSASTLGDALAALWTLYPGIRDRVANEQGQIREHINIFVGDENMRYTGGLATQINSAAEISIVPAVSGGIASECQPTNILPKECCRKKSSRRLL